MNKWDFSETELRDRFIIASEPKENIYLEVPVFTRSVDLVLQNPETARITAVEFKLHDWKRAILQVQSVGLCFDFLYICLPKPKTPVGCQNIIKGCEVNGVGLYLYDVEANIFENAVDSPKTTSVWEMQKKRVIDYLEAKEYGRYTENPKI